MRPWKLQVPCRPCLHQPDTFASHHKFPYQQWLIPQGNLWKVWCPASIGFQLKYTSSKAPIKFIKCKAPDLFRILSIKQEQLTNYSICSEIVNLVPKKNDSLAKQQAERISSILTGHNRAASMGSGHSNWQASFWSAIMESDRIKPLGCQFSRPTSRKQTRGGVWDQTLREEAHSCDSLARALLSMRACVEA